MKRVTLSSPGTPLIRGSLLKLLTSFGFCMLFRIRVVVCVESLDLVAFVLVLFESNKFVNSLGVYFTKVEIGFKIGKII